MSVAVARPHIAELVFHVYERSLHPELFEIYAERRFAIGEHRVTLRLCDTGHMLEIGHGDHAIAELTTTAEHALPKHKRVLDRKLRGCQHEAAGFDWKLQYQTSYQLEQLDATIFRQCHEEMQQDTRTADLAFCAPAPGRFGMGPISLLRVDANSTGLLVHAFHTFPECRAIVKTQSLFEFA